MVLVLIILSLGCILAYTLAVCLKFKGIPNSISATFYKLEHPYWFMATMWLTSGLLIPAILEVSNPNTDFLSALAVFGMMLVGAAPNFKDKFEGKVHVAGAIMTMVFSQTWVACNFAWALFLWLAYIVYTAIMMNESDEETFIDKYYDTNPLFWIESVCIITVFTSMFFLV